VFLLLFNSDLLSATHPGKDSIRVIQDSSLFLNPRFMVSQVTGNIWNIFSSFPLSLLLAIITFTCKTAIPLVTVLSGYPTSISPALRNAGNLKEWK
jgi:hypothetical protein